MAAVTTNVSPNGGGTAQVTLPGASASKSPPLTPWYKNQLFWGTVGSAALGVANAQLHLGVPADGPWALTIGLGVAWGAHVLLTDLADRKAKSRAGQDIVDVARAVNAALTQYGPALEASILAKLGKG